MRPWLPLLSELATGLQPLVQGCHLRHCAFHFAAAWKQVAVISSRSSRKCSSWWKSEWPLSTSNHTRASSWWARIPTSHFRILNKTSCPQGNQQRDNCEPGVDLKGRIVEINKLSSCDMQMASWISCLFQSTSLRGRFLCCVPPQGHGQLSCGQGQVHVLGQIFHATGHPTWSVEHNQMGIPTLGKNVVVAGRLKNVGMPLQCDRTWMGCTK